ncbi:MAG: cell envelope integrity protein CreD [Spirochaetales bacterium]|nr:cell envelope integrity protein CreD [Spirochaetales bacterium]
MKNRISGITDSQGFKAGTLVGLTLIMLIPITMVVSLISERSYRAASVKEEISSSAGGILQFAGPVIKVPGKRSIEKIFINSEGRKSSEFYEEEFTLWFTPEDLEIEIDLDTENKFRGIFYSPVFTGEISLSGRFNLGSIDEELEDNEKLHPENAELIIPFSNQKGIRGINKAEWNGTEVTLHPGNRGLNLSSGGIYTEVPFSLAGNEAKPVTDFSFKIMIRGAGKVSILPLATSTSVDIRADWPAPSFGGFCLPDSHNITDERFSARWNCSSLSSGIPVKWNDQRVFDEYSLMSSYIETDFINVHDHYGQNERAAKYAILFILIPFITLFLFEHFFDRRIHIIQYILAGIANIIFYLLLLSLSEHISFNLSYLISSAAVTLMLCLYFYSVLRDSRAAAIAPVMIFVYLFLFITLQSEDWALLIGASGVFVITGFIMFITRKIDFYQSRQNQK